MTPRRTMLSVLCCVAAAVLATLVLTGPNRSDHSETTAAGDADHTIHGPAPDTAGPAEAAQQALTALFTWQPVIDATTGAALSRAQPWLTGELARTSQPPPATGVRELPQWAAWRRSGDIVTARATAQTITGCDHHHCAVAAVVTQTVLHRDGTSTPYRVIHVHAATEHTADGWKLSDFHIQQ